MHWEAFQEGEEMAAFLSTQKRLETLYLSDGLSHPVDSRACSTLRFLIGDSTTIESCATPRLQLPAFGGHFRALIAMKINHIYEVSVVYPEIENPFDYL